MDFADLDELADFTELTDKEFLPPGQSYLHTEHDIYGMEYFCFPAWVSCLPALVHLPLS